MFFTLKKFLTVAVVAFFASVSVAVFGAPEKSGNEKKSAPGGIVFVGDSITNGGKFLAGPVASYRYQLFKNFVDSGVKFEPMGMTRGPAWRADVSAQTANYRGVVFENVSEAAASGRAYQYAGHGNEKMANGNDFKSDPRAAFPEKNRGPVTLKLGLPNPFIKDKKAAKDSFYDGTVLKKYAGDTYRSLYGNKKVETLCVMIGINDLYDAWEPDEAIVEHVHGIVSAFQKHNPAVRVHVFELLPTGRNNGTGTNNKNNVARYNALLRETAPRWSRGKSVVSCDDVSRGFYAEDGSMIDTDRGAHPNAQGELIVAGNIARVLGVGQRDAGLKRERAKALRVAEFSESDGAVKISVGEKKFTSPAAGTQGWKVDSRQRLVLDTPAAGASDFRANWATLGGASGGKKSARTLALKVKMTASSRADNFLGIIFGNGEDVGVLLVGESGIFWNDKKTLLYGSKSADAAAKIFTKKSAEIRIAWKPDDKTRGGFYVWVGDQLVGEALAGTPDAAVVSAYKNSVLVGDIGSAYSVGATIDFVAFDEKNAFAPENVFSKK